MDVRGKKLLVIGGSSATVDLVKNAREMGVHVTVADMSDRGPAYAMADEGVLVSTTDLDGLCRVIREKAIDGVFCGPSEFNIGNTMKLCRMAGLPFYTDETLWNRCADKLQFRSYCRKNGVDVAAEYAIDGTTDFDALTGIEYPVIIKPVDGCSSKGISVCNSNAELKAAYGKARAVSASGKVVVEQYIDTAGRGFSFRYLVSGGKAYPYLLMDTFIADPVRRKCLVSAFSYGPSGLAEAFLQGADKAVRAMIADMGIQNGTVFIQCLPYRGKFYCHDMGYRLSGGMIYKMTEPLNGINDMKMMIRYALGGAICEAEDLARLEQPMSGRCSAQLMLPLDAGTIAQIRGWEQIKALPQVSDVLQYYAVGDTVTETVIGTLGQHLARLTLVTDTREQMQQAVETIHDLLSVRDPQGRELYTMRFDVARMEHSAF